MTAPSEYQPDRLERAFEIALARHIKEKERQSLLKFLAAQRDYYGKSADDAAKLLGAVTPSLSHYLDVAARCRLS